jgi:hypothetical protein
MEIKGEREGKVREKEMKRIGERGEEKRQKIKRREQIKMGKYVA